ncbi:MAG: (S)-benzoin forming benzil reductase [Clostridia bacterium]|nr:(S)-benzoin forming benzil reductase [Clostridia bacterium]
MEIFIITGTTKGLGHALVKNLIHENHHIISLSRSKSEDLMALAESKGCHLNYEIMDLNDIDQVEKTMEAVFKSFEGTEIEEITLINNAGVVLPVGKIGKTEISMNINNLHVNLVAPVVTMSKFVEKTQNLKIKKRILNISSGAGKKPYEGWSSYCASKSGLNMYSLCLNLEQKKEKYPVEVLSLAPFIMDTDMQNTLRNSKEEDFPLLEMFKDFKSEGKLLTPNQVAEIICKLIQGENWPEEVIADVRDYL